MTKRVAIIAGAGPAGLTAALELLDKTDVVPIVYEADSMVGGLAKTVNYKGNRIDIGGHRFFSKSSRVMDWWAGSCRCSGGGARRGRLARRAAAKRAGRTPTRSSS
jgi:predicted NAD/FAD-dependent oxidoreductase